MNMIPLHKVTIPNYLVIQFNSCKNILMMENYCIDPDCDCNEVILNFMKLDEDHNIKNHLLDIKLDLVNGKIIEKVIIDKMINADEIIDEFNNHIYQFKDHLNNNNDLVKKYYSEYHENELPKEAVKLINENNCVAYRMIFSDIEPIEINYQNNQYLIEDQYCMKPSCTCNEVIVIVYKPKELFSELVFRLDLNNHYHEILKYNGNIDSSKFIDYVIEKEISVFKTRYNRMKQVGEKYLGSNK